MKNFSKLLSAFILTALMVASANAAGPKVPVDDAQNDLRDTASLQRGAVLFSEYCMACHSVKYMRYNRIARDLGWTDEEVIAKMAYGLNKPVDDVLTRMMPEVGLEVLGSPVPDLSLISRVKGTDYIYTFLRSYVQDEDGKWNNTVLKGTSMPHVLEGLQRHSTEEEFNQHARDISNFLEYTGEPGKVKRWDLGWKVIAFLFVLFILAYLLKREYWRDIKH